MTHGLKSLKELEEKVLGYEAEFEELKTIPKPATRHGKLAQLYVRYTNDNDVTDLATIYSWGSWHKGTAEKLERLVKMRRDIASELVKFDVEHKKFDTDFEKVKYILLRAVESREAAIDRIAANYFAKRFEIRPEDLDRRIGAQLTVPALY